MFLKIFVWFWLAMAMIVGAVVGVYFATRSAPLQEQWRTFIGEEIDLNSETAVQIFENEGTKGLEEYLARMKTRRRVNSIGFFDRNHSLIAGDLQYGEIEPLFKSVAESGQTEFVRLPDKTYGAKLLRTESGDEFIYVLELHRFRAPPINTETLVFSALLVIAIVSLVCYALASYISAPISRLRRATQSFAAGNLEARVSVPSGQKGDEIAELSRDFNEMGERIGSLITAEKRLTQDISHELRSPLARMNIALELARNSANEETMPQLNRLSLESERLNDLISQLLTLSKLESGTDEFEKQIVNLTTVVMQTADDADFEARGNKKSVELGETQKALVFGNETLIRSAIENVLRNAVKYSPENKPVKVSIKNNAKNSVVCIEDAGGGVPEDEIENIFKPFYRVHQARERKTGGNGIGLAITSRAMKNHNGTITAKNTIDGFLVELTFPLFNG